MRLEKRIIKSFLLLREIVNGNGRFTREQFYQEYHHYERLNERLRKSTGQSFDPVRYIEEHPKRERYINSERVR